MKWGAIPYLLGYRGRGCSLPIKNIPNVQMYHGYSAIKSISILERSVFGKKKIFPNTDLSKMEIDFRN